MVNFKEKNIVITFAITFLRKAKHVLSNINCQLNINFCHCKGNNEQPTPANGYRYNSVSDRIKHDLTRIDVLKRYSSRQTTYNL